MPAFVYLKGQFHNKLNDLTVDTSFVDLFVYVCCRKIETIVDM